VTNRRNHVSFVAISMLSRTNQLANARTSTPRPPGAAPVRTYPVEAVAAPIGRPSQARAARRWAARRDEQAVSAWLRELASRPR
jgi:hypothetical protein